MRWVVPPKRDDKLISPFVTTYGNAPSTSYEYAYFALIVNVGRFGERQLGNGKEAYHDAEFRGVLWDDTGDAIRSDSEEDAMLSKGDKEAVLSDSDGEVDSDESE